MAACTEADERFSITLKMGKPLHGAFAAILEYHWTAIPYIMEGAAVAEFSYTLFAAKKGFQALSVDPAAGAAVNFLIAPLAFPIFEMANQPFEPAIHIVFGALVAVAFFQNFSPLHPLAETVTKDDSSPRLRRGG